MFTKHKIIIHYKNVLTWSGADFLFDTQQPILLLCWDIIKLIFFQAMWTQGP